MVTDGLFASFGRRLCHDPAVPPGSLVGLLLAWTDRARQRCALADLDERQLRDIGLSARDVETEAAKPFWQR